MTGDRPPIDGDRAAINTRSLAAVTNAPGRRLDGRTTVGRRVRDLYRALTERLGSPADILTQADILALVELKIAAEMARARLLESGSNKDNYNVVRIENLVRRAEIRVGLVQAKGAKPEPMDIGASLAALGYKPPRASKDDDEVDELADDDDLDEDDEQ
jgi:hypothetical protein